MSTTATAITARCVHCTWNTDIDRGPDLDEVRSIHELIHPGGTVFVGGEEPVDAANGKPQASATPRSGSSKWTTAECIRAIQTWTRVYGSPPTSQDWSRGSADHPTADIVKRRFGSWGDGIVAAGFERPGRGGVRRRQPDAAGPPPAPRKEPASARTTSPDEDAAETVTPAGAEAGLVALAQRVTELTERRRAALAELDAIEADLRDALGAAQEALQAHELEHAV